jgi:acetylornithine deacetylase/succinyl-diaminopimelate desuccinylase-like protein
MPKLFKFCLVALSIAAGTRAASGLPAAVSPPKDAASSLSVPAEDRQLAHQLFQQLIEINTSHSVGSVTLAAQAMRQRLLDGGFPSADLVLAGPTDRKQNLIARFRGSGKGRPVVILCHLDVVEAPRSEWTTDPFRFIEKDGYFYGRGTQDIKDNDAIAVETFIRLKREAYQPGRDLILLLTADEETGPDNGVAWLVEHRPELFRNVEFAINLDAGGVDLQAGRPLSVTYEAAEKTYADFELSAHDPGGHSSLPHGDNPIVRVSDGLAGLQASPFPLEMNAVVREFLALEAPRYSAEMQRLVHAALAAPADSKTLAPLAASSALLNALLRTTCTPTRFDAGQANNALPELAKANVNCRILPGHSPLETQQQITKAVNNPKIEIRYCSSRGECGAAPSSGGLPPVAPVPEVLSALKGASAQLYPGVPLVPEMETGSSDSVYTMRAGIPSYGISGVGIDEDDVRAHGKDERLRVSSFYEGLAFFYLFLRDIGS